VTVIQPNVTLHDAHGHQWRTAPGFQDRDPGGPDWLLLRRTADGAEMPYARVVDIYGYGSDDRRYLLGRFDHRAIGPSARREIEQLTRIAMNASLAVDERTGALLTAHQRRDVGGCLCGWAELGKSHSGHQAEMLARAGLLAAARAPHHTRDAEETP
jgi:hypothetical protein